MDDKFSNDRAKVIRRDWFLFLDEVEPFHSLLYSYCLKLTGNVWDAEDLLQDVLLKSFGGVARGDFHGEKSPVANAKVYLFRTTTDHWLALQRRAQWTSPYWDEEQLVEADGLDVRNASAAMEKALSMSSPDVYAAVLLSEIFGFPALDIADFIGASEQGVKSVLIQAMAAGESISTTNNHPGSKKPTDSQARGLSDAFVDAMNSGEVSELKDLMAEYVQITVCNVGGGRGRDGIWNEKTGPGLVAEYGEYQGQGFIALYRMDTSEFHSVVVVQGDAQGDVQADVQGVREGAVGKVVRIKDYSFAKDTLARIAAELGVIAPQRGYHQPWETIEIMVATTALPWD